MPTNLPAEWNKYYEAYQNAKTPQEKIRALEEVIAHTPKNKATEKILGRFKRKLAEHRKESEKRKGKGGSRSISIRKEGDAQVSILGLANSGKSTFLKKITNSGPRIAEYPFTTVEPEVGMFEFGDVKIQVIEIPSTFTPEVLSIARNSDLVMLFVGEILNENTQIRELRRMREEQKLENCVFIYSGFSREETFRKVWDKLELIRVYTTEQGRPAGKPMVMKAGSTVQDAARGLHKDFLRYFRYAKISGPSAKFEGERVGLEHVLKDRDIVEFHMRK